MPDEPTRRTRIPSHPHPLLLSQSRFKAIFILALPIIGGMLSQNLFNLVDTAMVGSLGNAALAAVGIGGFAAFCANALVQGLGAGVQAIASRRHGEGQTGSTAASVNAGILISILVGVPFSCFLFWLVPTIFPLLNQDPAVIEQGVPYLQARVLSMVFVGINMSFRGFWNGIHLSKHYLRSLLIMHASNIFLNYCLIFGEFGFPQLGVLGAGIGSAVSTVIGSAIYFSLGIRFALPHGFLKVLPSRRVLLVLSRLALPAGVQQMFFAGGFTALYWIIGQIGTPQLAAANILINVMLVSILPGIGLGHAAASFVGQALGQGDFTDARRWGWDVAKIGMVMLGILGLPMLLAPHQLAGLFVSDPSTIEIVVWPMRLSGVVIAVEGIGLVLVSALQGAGDTRRTMFASTASQWLFMLPLAWFVGPYLGHGLLAIWSVWIGYRIVLTFIYIGMWSGHKWTSIVV